MGSPASQTAAPSTRELATEWILATELAQPIALLIVDVDHFKLFNDHYGHVQGDVCLRELSKIFTTGTRIRSDAAAHVADDAVPPSFRLFAERQSDFAARLGGEEFAVLLQGADLDAASRVAERLRRAVEDLRMPHETSPRGFADHQRRGQPRWRPAKGDNAPCLIEAADAGLYEAKRRGRNMVVAQSELVLSKAS